MRLNEVMNRDVDGVQSDAALADALKKLKNRDGEPVPVYDDGRLVGMVTDRDVVDWQSDGQHDAGQTTVRDVMRRDVVTCYADQDVRDAARVMQEHRVDGLIVLERGRSGVNRPIGVVSSEDLAAGVARATEDRGSRLPARVFLQPIAPPSILGLYGFAGATFIVAAQMAGWFGNSQSPLFLFPFAAFFGGLAQFTAGMWSYRARDGLATAMHGTWGSFWMGYGLLYLLFATGSLTPPTGAFPELGYWFIVLAAITWVGTIAALAENLILAGVLFFLAAGSTAAAYALIAANTGWQTAAGGLFIISALIAWYLASAMMLEGTFKRVIVPLGKYHRDANIPGRHLTELIEDQRGQPGVKAGQ